MIAIIDPTYEALAAACDRARAACLAADAAHMAALGLARLRGAADPHADPEVMCLAALSGAAYEAECTATRAVRRHIGTDAG